MAKQVAKSDHREIKQQSKHYIVGINMNKEM